MDLSLFRTKSVKSELFIFFSISHCEVLKMQDDCDLEVSVKDLLHLEAFKKNRDAAQYLESMLRKLM